MHADMLPLVTPPDPHVPRVLLAGVDTLYCSFDEEVSDAIWDRLNAEQQEAKTAEWERGAVHCPDWLNARLLPHGAKGGYRFLIETDAWTMKLLRGIPSRPPIFVELRSFALHTHPDGVVGAVHQVCGYLAETLFPHVAPDLALRMFNLDRARCSRLDLHVDWQGGDVPAFGVADEEHFLHPGRVKVGRMSEGRSCTGYTFGRRTLSARLYNKTVQATQAQLDWYFALLHQHAGDAYDPEQDVWRIEFQLLRDGVKGFRLYGTPDDDDPDTVLAAELDAEDLPTIGTVKKALHWTPHLWRYLTTRWLRWTAPTEDTNRARWPVRETWQVIQGAYDGWQSGTTLPDDRLALVRAHRHTGYARGLHRMGVGLLTALDCLDIDPGATQYAWLTYMHRMARLAARAQSQRWDACSEDERQALRILRGMGVRREKVAQCEQLLAMAVGVFGGAGVLALDLPEHVDCFAGLLEAVIGDLERIAGEKGGASQLARDKWRQRYKVSRPAQIYARSLAESGKTTPQQPLTGEAV